MTDAAVSDGPSPRRGWGRWVRRGLMGLVGAVVLLVIFHRPLGHWALAFFGERLATRAGLTATWRSSGSLVGDVTFNDLRVTGDEASVVRSITLEHGSVEYDLRRLRAGGVGEAVDRVVVRRLVADVDLTRRGRAARSAAPAAGGGRFQFPSVRVPVLEIDEVSLRLQLANGVVEVVDFSLSVDPAASGQLRVERFSAPGVPDLVEVTGATRATADTVIFERLSLWPATAIDRLVVQLADVAAGRLAVDLEAHRATATASVNGVVALGGDAGPVVEAQVMARDVTSETLAFWGVPDGGVPWASGVVDMQVNGPVLRPDRLAVDFTVTGGSLAVAGRPPMSVTGGGALRQGTLTLNDTRVEAGSGWATVKASAVAPARWSAAGGVAGEVSAVFDVPMAEAWVPEAAGVRGGVRGRATATVAQRALTGATADIEGTDVVVRGLPLEKVTATVTTVDGTALQATTEVRLNDTNVLEAGGGLELAGPQRFEVRWNAACPDLSTVPVEARADIPWPTGGSLTSEGTMNGSLVSLRARDWSQMTGVAAVDAAAIKVRDATMESLRVRVQVEDEEVVVDQLAMRFDAENTLTGTARLGIGETITMVAGQGRADLPTLARLSGWSTSFGGPAVTAGSASLEWRMPEKLEEAPPSGAGAVRVRGLQVAGVTEAMTLDAAVTQTGELFSLRPFSASLGLWRVEGTATSDGTRIEVPSLTAWAGSERIAGLDASLPLVAAPEAATVGRWPMDEPVSLNATIDGLDLARLGAALGRSLPVHGELQANAAVSGTMRTLTGSLTADVNKLRPASQNAAVPPSATRPAVKLDPATLGLRARLVNGQLTLDARAHQPPLEPITLEARAPVSAAAMLARPESIRDTPLTGRIRMPSSSLAFVPGWVPAVASVRGTATLDASVSGTIARPQWQATVAVVVPEARLAGSSWPSVRDLVVRVRADEKRITFQEAGVMVAGGRLSVQGGADLTRFDDPRLDLRLRANEVLVIRDDNVSMRANADVTCRGPLSSAAVAGTIDLVRGRVFKEIEFLPLSLPNQLPPPPPPTTLARTGPPSLPPPMDAWTFDVVIRTRDPVRLMGNVARGNVVADLRLAGTGARPVLTGRATMEQMWIRLPFSRLNITEGSLTFTEASPFDPQINVLGESITDGRVVQVRVEGRALDPTVRMTSSPPLSEGEIASLLATGVTTSDLSAGGSEVAGRAAFVVVQQAYRRMFRKSVRGTEDDEPPRLSFEFAWFGSDPSRRNLSAIYELNPQWRVIGRVGETGTFRGLLHYMIRFR